MKMFAGALIGPFIVAASAWAQTDAPAPAAPPAVPSSCSPVGAAPALPDGAAATREQMAEFNTTYTAWFTTNRDALTCRRSEVEAAQARWEALRNDYNAGAAALNAMNSAWEAEVAEFNARASNRSQTTRR